LPNKTTNGVVCNDAETTYMQAFLSKHIVYQMLITALASASNNSP